MSFDIEHQLQVVPRDETGAPGSSSGQRSDEAPISSQGRRSDEGSSSSRSWTRSCCSLVCKIVRGAVRYLLYLVGIVIGYPIWIIIQSVGAACLFVAIASVALPIALVALALAILAAAVAIGFAVAIPLVLIVVFSLPKKTAMRLTREDSPWKEEELADGIAGAYDRARWKEPTWNRIMIGSLGWTARVSLVVLFWLALSFLVPRLRAVALLGSPMWKWSLLGATLTAGYFQALTLILPVLLWPGSGNISYYINALLFSISHVTYMGLVLGTWLAYFRTHHGLNHHHRHDRAFDYGTWSFVSFFVGSVLLLFKNLLLLKWGANAIYRRFGPRILITSLKYYFIGYLAVGFDETAILDELNVVKQYGKLNETHLDQKKKKKLNETPDTNPKKLTTISKYVMSRKIRLSHLGYLSRILISLAQAMSPLLDGGDNEEVVTWFKQQISNNTSDTLQVFASSNVPTPSSPTGKWNIFAVAIQKIFTPGSWKTFLSKEKSAKLQKEEVWNVLCRLVGEECSSHAFTSDDLKIWMVDAHKDCINMGRTLADAKAIVTRLDIFMSFIIFVIVLLLWLLVTGVSSTTVLVTVATPFLALTFIFGDSAKMFFQGFIFYFATHPFDVGDRCILDGIELEVRSVSIFTTTFIKIGSKEKRMYPNSKLATEAIVNLGWQPDPKDVVELQFSASTNLDDLKMRINKFFVKESKRYGPTYNMVISEVGENIKVKIQFTHVLTVHDLSHSRCFQKKSSQRSEFLSMIKKHINKSRIEQMDVKNLSQSSASTSGQKRRIFRINHQRRHRVDQFTKVNEICPASTSE